MTKQHFVFQLIIKTLFHLLDQTISIPIGNQSPLLARFSFTKHTSNIFPGNRQMFIMQVTGLEKIQNAI